MKTKLILFVIVSLLFALLNKPLSLVAQVPDSFLYLIPNDSLTSNLGSVKIDTCIESPTFS